MVAIVRGKACITPEQEAQNIAHCGTLGLPYINEKPRPPLVVVGGAPSLMAYRNRLERFRGDIWAIGSAFQWCRRQGIDATFFCIDPLPVIAEFAEGAERAIVATNCAFATFEALKDAEVEIFDLQYGLDDANHGTTSATAAPWVALKMGYRDVLFVACDSSFDDTTHLYKDDAEPRITVRVGERDYLTTLALYMQAQVLASIIHQFPEFLSCTEDGLLGAMARAPEGTIADIVEDRASPPVTAARQGGVAVGATPSEPMEAA